MDASWASPQNYRYCNGSDSSDYESGEYSAAQLMDISGLSRSAMYATLNKAREEHRGSREHR